MIEGVVLCALCLRTLHVFFYRRGTGAKGDTQKAHNVAVIMLSAS